MLQEIVTKSAWKGFEWRLPMVTTAIIAMSLAKDRIKPIVEQLSDFLSHLNI